MPPFVRVSAVSFAVWSFNKDDLGASCHCAPSCTVIFKRELLATFVRPFAMVPCSLSVTLSSALGFTLINHPSFAATIKLRSEEHTSELQSRGHLVCRLLLDKKHMIITPAITH